MSKKNKRNNGISTIRRIIAIQRDLEELDVSKNTVRLEVRADSAKRINQTMAKAALSEKEFYAITEALIGEGRKSPMLEAFEAAQAQLWAD